MIQKIEELSMNALPALSTVLLNGWILRFSNGYSKRANSVNPIYECSIDIERNVNLCEAAYTSKGLDTVFKLTENIHSFKIDNLLVKRGYGYEAKTNIMLKEIHEFDMENEEKYDSVIYEDLRDDWFEAFIRLNKVNEKNSRTLKMMLQRMIPEACYACIKEDGVIEAVGLGVMEDGYVGMYDICVNESKRRRGLGTKVMKSLINEASKRGYQYSYLQVVDENEGAKFLYDMLGYKKQYSYWYRVKKFEGQVLGGK